MWAKCWIYGVIFFPHLIREESVFIAIGSNFHVLKILFVVNNKLVSILLCFADLLKTYDKVMHTNIVCYIDF